MAREVHVIARPVVVFNTVGRIASRVQNTLTLWACDDVKRIHVGMYLRAGVEPNYLRSGRFAVVATNEDTGTVTVDCAFAVTGLCDDDWLFWSAAEHR
jgi:hypothetical protein